MKTLQEVFAATSANPQDFFNRNRMREIRSRFPDQPVPLKDGGCLLIMTSKDPETWKGDDRDIQVLQVTSDGGVAIAWTANRLKEDMTHARKALRNHKQNITRENP